MGRVLLGALVVSVAGNGLLLYRALARRREANQAPLFAATRPMTPPKATEGKKAVSARTEPAGRSANPDHRPCEEQEADLAERIATAEKKLFDLLDTKEKFEILPYSDPPPALKKEIDRFFAGPERADLAYDLECHGEACRLQVLKPETDDKKPWWGDAFQQDREIRDLSDGWSFGPFFTVTDGGVDVHGDEAYMTFRGPGRMGGMELLQKLLAEFHGSGDPASCVKGTDAHGDLELEVRLNEASKTIEVKAGGPLAKHRAGLCIVERLRARAAVLTIPETFGGAVVFQTIPVRQDERAP